jgi:hypothetical protein
MKISLFKIAKYSVAIISDRAHHYGYYKDGNYGSYGLIVNIIREINNE